MSHAGAAVVPFRSAAGIWIRRASTTDEKATPGTFQSYLDDSFPPFGTVDAPREERVEKARVLAMKMLLDAGRITVAEDGKGQLTTPLKILKHGATSSRYSFVEFIELSKPVEERHALFRDYKTADVGCTVNTNSKVAITKKLLEQHLRRFLRDETRQQECALLASPEEGVVHTPLLRERWFGELDGLPLKNYNQIWPRDLVSARHDHKGVEAVDKVRLRPNSEANF